MVCQRKNGVKNDSSQPKQLEGLNFITPEMGKAMG